MPPLLPNPETTWRTESRSASDLSATARERVGTSFDSVRLLAGGQANLNLLLDGHRVLRVFARDPATAAKECSLLERAWEAFRVPKILDQGEDFLLLEWIELTPVSDSTGSGEKVGAAAAEIHATEFSEVGFLGVDLKVDSPLPSARGYVAATLEELGDPWIRRADEVVALLVQLDEDVTATVPVLNHGDFKPANLFLDSNGRLVILDWEFAFSGPHLFDLGQLFRWGASKAFRDGFAGAYERAGGMLPDAWQEKAEVLDLVNLLHLARTSHLDPVRCRHVWRRLDRTLSQNEGRK